ncbi:MAG: glycoside hydrolase family 3 C-terminal domain-containing protein [Lachnoclostridium sp.]|nr:glycoside hydrolase family 3 C-terminal domain-containing protein [Lachnoclostridium sp.]
MAVIGPLGNTVMLGGYSGSSVDLSTPLDGIAAKLNYTINDGTLQFEDCDETYRTNGSGISDIIADKQLDNDKIYNLKGQLMGATSDFDKLPSGFYIMKGSVVKK